MKEINCWDGHQYRPAKVDDDMYDVLRGYEWRINVGGYAYTFPADRPSGIAMNAMMHHCVIGRSLYDLETDHWDRDKLNNQRENLRQVSRSMNARNNGKSHKTPPPPDTEPQWANRSQTYQPYPTYEGPDPTDEEMEIALEKVKARMNQV